MEHAIKTLVSQQILANTARNASVAANVLQNEADCGQHPDRADENTEPEVHYRGPCWLSRRQMRRAAFFQMHRATAFPTSSMTIRGSAALSWYFFMSNLQKNPRAQGC